MFVSDPYLQTFSTLADARCPSVVDDVMIEIKEMTENAIEGDRRKDLAESYGWRMELIKLSALHGKCEYAIDPLMWCLRVFDHYEDRLKLEPLLWRYKWVLNSLANTSQIHQATIYRMQDDLESRLARAGYYAQPAHRIRVGHAMAMGDYDRAETYFHAYEKTATDALSDCEACLQADRVAYYRWRGQIDEALDASAPILLDEMTCRHLPASIYVDLLWCWFDQANYQQIRESFCDWYSAIEDDLDFAGDIADLMLWLVIDERFDLACGMLQRHAAVNLESPFETQQYGFARACAALFKRMDRTPSLAIELPTTLSIHRDSQSYSSEELAAYFEEYALSLAEGLDTRNGNGYYKEQYDRSIHRTFGDTVSFAQAIALPIDFMPGMSPSVN